ncbi:putative transposase [Palleronia aestuarii]|uniref:Putative transposase n=1 Tax=Palleronia aestuarii TaxID=568105 RepID=A0A2W7MQF5_9RHOB|nr:putative transposase [Palleronia aestuarii]
MERSRFSEEQVIGVLKEQEAEMSIAHACGTRGVSTATIWKRKARYGRLGVSEAGRLTPLNRRR